MVEDEDIVYTCPVTDYYFSKLFSKILNARNTLIDVEEEIYKLNERFRGPGTAPPELSKFTDKMMK